jgi:hypothetical protein|tara:strand:- start:43 stop:504 length:462 start_codon:yes stop_codon:yes gene_type:complete
MGTTTFSGPIKAGTIPVTTGTTVGSDMKNVGQVVMGQSASFDFEDTSATSTDIIIPANSQIVDIDVNVQVAFNGSGTNLIDIGVVGNPDLYIDGLSVAAIGKIAPATTALCANWKDIGTSDVRIQLQVTDGGGDASAGTATFTVSYLQNNNLS